MNSTKQCTKWVRETEDERRERGEKLLFRYASEKTLSLVGKTRTRTFTFTFTFTFITHWKSAIPVL